MATVRIVFIDTWGYPRAPLVPFLNRHALPAIGASACLFAAVGATRRLQRRLAPAERTLAAAAEVAGVCNSGWSCRSDLHLYCRSVVGARGPGDDRFAQMALSVLWAVYATAVLAAGFRLRRARLRWTALGLYGVTVAKVFLLDMAGLDEVFRILAFLVLAVLLGRRRGGLSEGPARSEKPGPGPRTVEV